MDALAYLPAPLQVFLTSNAVNGAWVAEQLYADRTPASRAKLMNKVTGRQGRRFSDQEIQRLTSIRERFLEQLR